MTKIIAHRGFSSRKLENTMASFEMAFKEKYVDIVELDIRMTKDNKIVCIHDSFIKSKRTKKEYIRDTNYDDLKKPILRSKDFFINLFKYASHLSSFVNLIKLLQYKRKKGTIPLLEEVLAILPDNKEVIVEIKGSNKDYEGIIYEEEILRVIDKYKNKKISIMSFDKDIVMSIKNKRPKLKMGILVKDNLEYIDLKVDFVSLSKNVVNYDILNKLVKEKKEIIVWTINTFSDYLFLKKRSKELVNKLNITTDFPDLIHYLLKKDINAK